MFRFLFVVMLALPAIVCADLYQWADVNGVKHFSNTPPENVTGAIRQREEHVADEKEAVDRLQKTIDLYDADAAQDAINQPRKRKSIPPVVIYTTPTCGYCQRAKAYFNQNSIRFTEHDITQSDSARKTFKALNGEGVPLIIIGDRPIAGFIPSAIDRALGLP